MSTTTTEPCTTGVINELDGCEPVGVLTVCYDTFENDAIPDCFVINGPAVVDLPPRDTLPAPVASVHDTIAETSIADPPQLPATGLEETLAVGAGVLLLSGILLARLARKERS